MSSEEDRCDFCDKPAKYTESIWGCYFWCADCEEEAAWQIYMDSVVEVGE
tara:strand:+ start:935 stop:1084 length:150 start_codon:yes stop_codon:yes gene_type:complete